MSKHGDKPLLERLRGNILWNWGHLAFYGDDMLEAAEEIERLTTLNEALNEVYEAAKDTENPCGEYYTGLRCGIEDRDISDRYGAAEYGWDQAFAYIDSILASAIAKVKGLQK